MLMYPLSISSKYHFILNIIYKTFDCRGALNVNIL